MAANYNQNLSAGSPLGGINVITTANTSNADVASPVDGVDFRLVFTASATNGGCVLEIGYQVRGTGAQLAGLIYIWQTDNAGANARIVESFTVAAGSTQSTTVAGQRDVKTKSFDNLEAGTKIFMSATVVTANCQFVVWTKGGSFTSL